jgi:hypothetical protein
MATRYRSTPRRPDREALAVAEHGSTSSIVSLNSDANPVPQESLLRTAQNPRREQRILLLDP